MNIRLAPLNGIQQIEKFFYTFLVSIGLKKKGKHFRIGKPILITPQYIEVGDYVSIKANARIEGIKQYGSQKFQPKIILGNNVSIEQNIHLTCANSIIIEDDVAIAANVGITDIIHPYDDIQTPIEKQPLEVKSVEIKKGCKINNNALILPGVKLGINNVVAANSVVKEGNYPDYCILAGAPAKIIKKYDESSNTWIK